MMNSRELIALIERHDQACRFADELKSEVLDALAEAPDRIVANLAIEYEIAERELEMRRKGSQYD